MPPRTSAADFDPSDFSRRHIGPSPADMSEMLSTVGVSDIDELISQTVPDGIRQTAPLALPPGISESEALQKLRIIADKNKVFTSLIGQGYYGTILPPVIQRNILENPAWYTAYTPYQAEISQGRLEALLNFQTMISELCVLDVANASLLDEATAAAEAMAMARRVVKSQANAFFVDADWLWRSARRLYRNQGCVQARASRSHCRRVGRLPRPARLSARSANAGAAHPPREGDLQHLHRASSSRRGRRNVCDLSRPGRS